PITKEPMTPPPRRATPIDERAFLVLDGEAIGSTFDFILDDDGMPRFLRLGGRLSDRVDPS
ncbi:MAG: serine hydrolase, partial [Dehalococcoidia bacterium]